MGTLENMVIGALKIGDTPWIWVTTPMRSLLLGLLLCFGMILAIAFDFVVWVFVPHFTQKNVNDDSKLQ